MQDELRPRVAATDDALAGGTARPRPRQAGAQENHAPRGPARRRPRLPMGTGRAVSPRTVTLNAGMAEPAPAPPAAPAPAPVPAPSAEPVAPDDPHVAPESGEKPEVMPSGSPSAMA